MIISFDWWREDIRELSGLCCEFGFHNSTVNVFELRYFFQSVISGIIFQYLIEWVAN